MTEAATDPVAPAGPRGLGASRAWAVAGVVIVVALVPLAFLGPGTDLDVGAVLRAGRSIVDDGTYVASRTPGAPVHETGVGLLERVGGIAASNLGSLAAAVALIAGLVGLLRREGVGRVGLVAAVVVANPWFLIAATSTVDFLWALALWTGAALALRARPTWGGAAAAGALAGLAVGARSSTAFLVAGLLLAEALDALPGATSDRDRRGTGHRTDGSIDGAGAGRDARPTTVAPHLRALVAGAAGAAVGLALFVPSFRAAGSSLAFAQNDVPTSTPLVQVGRFLAKDLYFFGPFAAVVLLLCVPAAGRAAMRWRADWIVRLGLLTILVSQVLFLRFPWKMGHLLPTLVGVALLLGRALGDRPRLLVALVVAQAAYAVASITLITPDNPNAATGGELTFEPRWGALVTDVRCRADDPDAWEGPGIDRLNAVWDCAKPWAPPDP